MMNLLKTRWLVALAAIVMLSGCGGGGPDVQYVEGVVTLDGKPVEGVSVGFSPTDQISGSPAVGRTDANGVYKLTAMGGGEAEAGTAAGEYNVSFSKTTSGSGGGMSYEDTQKMMEDPNYGKDGGGAPSAPPETTNVVPKGYNNPLTSGFTVVVKKGENKGGEFDFELKSDYEPPK